jgi:hypothetical protein
VLCELRQLARHPLYLLVWLGGAASPLPPAELHRLWFYPSKTIIYMTFINVPPVIAVVAPWRGILIGRQLAGKPVD